MDNVNNVSYTLKLFEKMQDRTFDVWKNWSIKCPFDDIRGNMAGFVDHAIHASKHGIGYRTRANHEALLKYISFKEPDKSSKEVSQ